MKIEKKIFTECIVIRILNIFPSELFTQVIFQRGTALKRRPLSEIWLDVASALCKGDDVAAIHHVLDMDISKDIVDKSILLKVQKELEGLCKKSHKSAFRDSSLDALQHFDLKQQELELQSEAPTFYSILQMAAEPQRIERNVQKTKETLLPNMLTAASVLLNSRNQYMNSHQTLNSLTLKEAACKKSAFHRLNARGLCTSYQTTLHQQTECGEGFDAEVKEWAENVCKANEEEKKLLQAGQMDDAVKYNENRTDKSYQLVMDNVDVVVHARHPTRDNYGKDIHMVQMMAVQHRVSGHHLPNTEPIASAQSVDSSEFLPNTDDNMKLRRDWVILSAKMLADHIPALKPMLDALPPHITHEHMAEMKTKSKVVSIDLFCVYLNI